MASSFAFAALGVALVILLVGFGLVLYVRAHAVLWLRRYTGILWWHIAIAALLLGAAAVAAFMAGSGTPFFL